MSHFRLRLKIDHKVDHRSMCIGGVRPEPRDEGRKMVPGSWKLRLLRALPENPGLLL